MTVGRHTALFHENYHKKKGICPTHESHVRMSQPGYERTATNKKGRKVFKREKKAWSEFHASPRGRAYRWRSRRRPARHGRSTEGHSRTACPNVRAPSKRDSRFALLETPQTNESPCLVRSPRTSRSRGTKTGAEELSKA